MVVTLAATTLAVIAQFLAAPQPFRIDQKPFFAARPPAMPLFQPLQGSVVSSASPQTLCTMPMLRPHGPIDPKIVVEPQTGVDFKIRTIDASACVERSTR